MLPTTSSFFIASGIYVYMCVCTREKDREKCSLILSVHVSVGFLSLVSWLCHNHIIATAPDGWRTPPQCALDNVFNEYGGSMWELERVGLCTIRRCGDGKLCIRGFHFDYGPLALDLMRPRYFLERRSWRRE